MMISYVSFVNENNEIDDSKLNSVLTRAFNSWLFFRLLYPRLFRQVVPTCKVRLHSMEHDHPCSRQRGQCDSWSL